MSLNGLGEKGTQLIELMSHLFKHLLLEVSWLSRMGLYGNVP